MPNSLPTAEEALETLDHLPTSLDALSDSTDADQVRELVSSTAQALDAIKHRYHSVPARCGSPCPEENAGKSLRKRRFGRRR